jgi:hypothetical protein
MGTSSDHSGGSGGPWTPFKRAATSYAKHGGADRAGRMLARHVATLGGAAAAAASARTGTTAAQRLGGLLAGVATEGLTPTLERFGLADQVGRDRFEVLDALITYIAGSGSDLEAQAARNAACDILDELFPEGVDYDDLTAVVIDAAALELMLTLFLAAYIYNRVPIIAERLTRLGDRHAAERADGELRDYIRAYVDLQLGDDPLAIDWTGAEGRLVIEQAIQAVYALLEAYEADESGEP